MRWIICKCDRQKTDDIILGYLAQWLLRRWPFSWKSPNFGIASPPHPLREVHQATALPFQNQLKFFSSPQAFVYYKLPWKNSEKWYSILNVQIFKHIQFNSFETLILLMIQMRSQSYHCLPNNPIKEDTGMLRLWGKDSTGEGSQKLQWWEQRHYQSPNLLYIGSCCIHIQRSGRFTPLGFSLRYPSFKSQYSFNDHSSSCILCNSLLIFVYWNLKSVLMETQNTEIIIEAIID